VVIASMQPAPLLIELVGPPGAGKTTFAQVLCRCTGQVAITRTPYFRELRYIPFFIYNSILLLPTFARLYTGTAGQELTPREAALMVLLSGWQRELQREIHRHQKSILLDEGPICYLSRLYAFGSAAIKGPGAQGWWQSMLRLWSQTLDVVIRLDNPDPTLVDRIRARAMAQEVKELPDQLAFQYLDSIRSAQDHVLAALANDSRGPRVLAFDTLQYSPDQISTQIIHTLGL
jgi:thymidylate kinase